MDRNLRERLEELLRETPTSVGDAERAARAAEALAAYLRLENRVEEIVGGRDEGGEGAGREISGNGLQGLTLHVAAEKVLERAGVPLHVRELGKRIKAGGWRHPRSENPDPDQINYQLAARLPRHADVFMRVAPNTFGLRKWGEAVNRRPRPRLGTFTGPSKPIGREVGENPDFVFEGMTWR